jgi:putative salt-induced outer membrane protein YdiY
VKRIAKPRRAIIVAPPLSIAVPAPHSGTAVATRPFTMLNRYLLATALLVLGSTPGLAQPPPKEPPPLWDAQVAASFVGTSGNSDTASTGADFAAHRRGAVWLIDSAATGVLTRSNDEKTAERYLGMIRGQRKLTPMLGISAGEKLERDKFAGIALRSILDAGLTWALVRRTVWTVDGVTALAWNHESRTIGSGVDDPIGLFQLLSRVPFGTAGDMTQRFTYYPNFMTASAYRSEAELTAQAAMATHLALKIGYLLRHSNVPVPGFKKTDNTTTASVVLRWKAATPAPAP